MKYSIRGFLLALMLPVMLVACQEGGATKASRFAPTNLPPVMPTGDFTAYIAGARSHAMAVNDAAGTPISTDELAAVGPFELRPAPQGRDCRGNAEAKYDRGVLLIHGLNDTPFSMWDLGHRFAKDCYLVRAILLPGHGTVPGDLLNVGLPAWREAVSKAVWSFRGEVDRLVIAGFDLGANLALDAALELNMPAEVELNGLVMLAPAFDYDPPDFAPAAVGPGGAALWGQVFEKHNAFRYHSVARPSIAATNSLGGELLQEEAPRHLPLFMVLSAEDAVTDARIARDWFCSQNVTPRHLLWYSRYPEAPFPDCRCTVQRRNPTDNESKICVSVRPSSCVTSPARNGSKRQLPTAETCGRNPFESKNSDSGGAILDLAHIALLAAPENPRYGASAEIYDCLHYSFERDTPEGQLCAGLSNGDGGRYLRYGEMSDGNLGNYVLRRLTYNPDFDHMAERMIDFLRRSN
ncbi:MAG: alpha/beta fold hydrolase [Pseudomonadota bacterium]